MTVRLIQGDITTQVADVIVNAANPGLLGGGGVDGAIHQAAGPTLMDACAGLRASILPDGLRPGMAVATTAGDLKARWVIHAVGPRYNQARPAVFALHRAFVASAHIAQRLGAGSAAFPAIGAGVYGWPPDRVARIALGALRPAPVEDVRIVLFTDEAYAAFASELEAKGRTYSLRKEGS